MQFWLVNLLCKRTVPPFPLPTENMFQITEKKCCQIIKNLKKHIHKPHHTSGRPAQFSETWQTIRLVCFNFISYFSIFLLYLNYPWVRIASRLSLPLTKWEKSQHPSTNPSSKLQHNNEYFTSYLQNCVVIFHRGKFLWFFIFFFLFFY